MVRGKGRSNKVEEHSSVLLEYEEPFSELECLLWKSYVVSFFCSVLQNLLGMVFVVSL